MNRLVAISTVFLATTTFALPVPDPQLGVSLNTPVGSVTLGNTPAPNTGYRPNNGYNGYGPSLGSVVGDIASSVAYGIGDQLARGGSPSPSYGSSTSYGSSSGSRPSYGSGSGSVYEWERGQPVTYSPPDRPLISTNPNDRPLISIAPPERGSSSSGWGGPGGWGGWGGPGGWGGGNGGHGWGGPGGWGGGGWRRDSASGEAVKSEIPGPGSAVPPPVQKPNVKSVSAEQVTKTGEGQS